jgi:hypothetical protein
MVAADLIHPTPQGARIVAQDLTAQLLIGYERYLQHHMPRGNPAASVSRNLPARLGPNPSAANSSDFISIAESRKKTAASSNSASNSGMRAGVR